MLRHNLTSWGSGRGYNHAEIGALIDTFPALGPLRDLPPAVHARLAMLARIRTFVDGTALLRQDEDADYAFLILDGMVRLEHVDAQGESTLREIGPGAVLGAPPMLGSDRRRATATAVGDVEALTLNRVAVALTALQFPAAAALRLVFLS